MPVFSDGQKITSTEWARLIQSVPASYVIWKDGSTYRAECLLKGGTDYSGTDAATVIQSAIDALTSGRIVLKGDFVFSNVVNIYGKQNLVIEGNEAVIKPSQNYEGTSHEKKALFNIEDSCNIHIKGLRTQIDWNEQSSSLDIVIFYIWNSTMVTIENNRHYDDRPNGISGGVCLVKMSSDSLNFENKHIFVLNNIMESESATKGHAVAFIDTGQDVVVKGNKIIQALDTLVYAAYAKDVWIECNYIYGWSLFLDIPVKNNVNISNFYVVNNIQKNCGAAYVATSNALLYVWASQPSITAANVKNIYFVGNVIEGDSFWSPSHIIYIRTKATNMVIENIVVRDNKVVNPTIAPPGYGVCLEADGEGDVIRNILVEGNDIVGVRYCFYLKGINGGCIDGLTITNNKLEADTAVLYIYSGSDIQNLHITGNLGFTTTFSGTATITSSTYVDVTHGLAGTPTVINVTPATSGTGDWYISDIGATTFRINVANSGTYTFYWTAEYKP